MDIILGLMMVGVVAVITITVVDLFVWSFMVVSNEKAKPRLPWSEKVMKFTLGD